jgi:hypothetical protein
MGPFTSSSPPVTQAPCSAALAYIACHLRCHMGQELAVEVWVVCRKPLLAAQLLCVMDLCSKHALFGALQHATDRVPQHSRWCGCIIAHTRQSLSCIPEALFTVGATLIDFLVVYFVQLSRLLLDVFQFAPSVYACLLLFSEQPGTPGMHVAWVVLSRPCVAVV